MMTRRTEARGGLFVVVFVMMMAGFTAPITAQVPEEYTNLKVLPEDISRRQLLAIMRGFTRALGVRCSTCHVGEESQDLSEYDFASDDEPTKRTAREMLEMVQSINENVIFSLVDRGTPEIEVGCVTCHAGRRRPTTLLQELTWAAEDGGWAAAEARYDELRERYYGLGTLNFGPRTLEDLATGLLRADDLLGALAALDLNLGLYPESANSWTLKGQVHMRSGQTEEAIAALERSLELLPGNPRVLQVLERLKGGG